MKQSKTLGVYLIIAATIIKIETQSPPPPKQCQGIDLKISEEKMMNMMECLKDGGFESFKDITKEKFPCVFTCIMKKRMVIDEAGVLRKENVQQLVNEDLPEEVRTDLNARIGVCFDEHGSKVSADDPNCLSMDLVECVRMSYVNVCKE